MTKTEAAKLLLGRPGRLRLAEWILGRSEETFFQQQAVKGTGDVPTEVRLALENFAKLGLIEIPDRDWGSARRQYYRRLDSPIWKVFEVAIDVLAVHEFPETPSRPTGSSVGLRP